MALGKFNQIENQINLNISQKHYICTHVEISSTKCIHGEGIRDSQFMTSNRVRMYSRTVENYTQALEYL